jgi:hypothetical protein
VRHHTKTILVSTVAISAAVLMVVPAPATAVAAPAPSPLGVDFGASSSTPADGYVLDHGQPYGLRSGADQGQNLVYGWVVDGESTPLALNSSGRERQDTGLTDAKLANFVQMRGPSALGSWELKVVDGWYMVAVGLGDAAANYDSLHTVTAEGVRVVDPFAPTDAHRLRSGAALVRVSDGRLTIRADTGSNVKITYLTIVDMPAPDEVASSVMIDFGSATSTPAAGNLLDFGQPFGPRPGFVSPFGPDAGEFGWVVAGSSLPVDLVGSGRQRALAAPDPRQQSFVHMQDQPAASGRVVDGDWAMTVPNGRYRVAVGAGDAGNNYDSEHVITVEGVGAIDAFVPTFDTKFGVAVLDVSVRDSTLTVSAAGGMNTKLDFIEVQALQPTDAPLVPLDINEEE